MEVTDREFVTKTLAASVIEFFSAYGVQCHPQDPVPSGTPGDSEMEMGSIVGFKGSHVRGGLAFVAPAELVARLLPVPAKEAKADMQLRDWSAEIANQLIGRLKNKLSARAIDFDVGTPVCFRGKSIRLAFLPDATGVSLAFHTQSSGVRVYLDCAIAPQDGDADPDAVRIVPEGEVLLF